MKIDQGEDDFIYRPHNFGRCNKKLFKVDYSFLLLKIKGYNSNGWNNLLPLDFVDVPINTL